MARGGVVVAAAAGGGGRQPLLHKVKRVNAAQQWERVDGALPA